MYPLGCVVFAGILYFTLSRFLGLSTGVSLAIAIPVGVAGFFVFASLAEGVTKVFATCYKSG